MSDSYKSGGISSYGTHIGNCDDCDDNNCEDHGKHQQGCSKWFPNKAYMHRKEQQYDPWDY